jgi:hypothetical protein
MSKLENMLIGITVDKTTAHTSSFHQSLYHVLAASNTEKSAERNQQPQVANIDSGRKAKSK